MCFEGQTFDYLITEIMCARCGATEGWREVGERHRFKFLQHTYKVNYGLVDECEALTGEFLCPGCGGYITEHYIDCRRDGVGEVVSKPLEIVERRISNDEESYIRGGATDTDGSVQWGADSNGVSSP